MSAVASCFGWSMVMADVHVVQVVFERDRLIPTRAIVSIGTPGDPRRYHYGEGEAASSAVCHALETVIRKIARWEVPAGDGFTVKVVFVNEAGELLTPPEPGPGDAAFAEMEAIADADDG